MTITAFEHLVASAELRALAAGAVPEVRMTDLLAILPAVTGKVELVYEGEQEGPESVAHHLIGKAIRAKFPEVFPDPELIRRRKLEDVYAPVVAHVAAHGVEVLASDSNDGYRSRLEEVSGLGALVDRYVGPEQQDRAVWMEFVLHGLAEHNLVGKEVVGQEVSFSDLMSGLFASGDDE